MIGLDTNVLARLFVEDDIRQARAARQFVRERCSPKNPAFVDRVALCEMVWVLTSVHGFRRAEIAAVIEQLLASADIALEDSESVAAALPIYRSRGIDFADLLMGEVNWRRGCDTTATFDRRAARLTGFTLVA